MRLEWLALANYAEEQGGLLYVVGGGWDTINVHGPLEVLGAPPEALKDVFCVIQGMLVIRLLVSTTETNRAHKLVFEIVDEDGQQVMSAEGEFNVSRQPSLPIGWDQAAGLVFPLTGTPLPRPGNYTINLSVDDEFLGDRPFRVLKLYS